MANQLRPRSGLDALGNNGPRLLFADHHERIEARFRELLMATRVDDPNDRVAHFHSLERELLAHMAEEEEVILPAYEYFHPDEAWLMRVDHARIRLLLSRLGVEVALDEFRAEALEPLIDALRCHRAQEDAQMYRWAQVHLPLRAKDAFVMRLTRWLRQLRPLLGASGAARACAAGSGR